MLHASLFPVATALKTAAPAPTQTFTPIIATAFMTEPVKTATPPPDTTKTMVATALPISTVLATLPYVCSNNVCTASGSTGTLFQTLQALINMGNKKLANGIVLVVDGKLDARTLSAYMPISRAVGGPLAIFDFTPTPEFLAKNADAFSREIAKWVGMTWVNATADVPGHWERLRAGQTVNLPPNTVAALPPAPTTAPTAPTTSTASTASTTTPTPVKQTPTHTYVQTAPAPTKPAAPAPAPAPAASEAPAAAPVPAATVEVEPAPATDGKFRGCIARFNKTRKVYAIYCPPGSEGATPGLGYLDQEYFRCLRGSCTGLGADTVTPPPPAGYVKAAEVTTLPRAGETQAGDERDKFFRLKNPLMWAAFAGAAAVIGGGSYALYRRRRAPSSFSADTRRRRRSA